ncbi:f32288ad-980c-456f-9155-2d5c369d118e [Sclerotinia trifoliorum]|uniref:F32288ad-980c-456f-9155-2d5c369d118e n=1 Tax=Sclerotinia trifoliorum TaxID=28548 RepID=A0A8H2W495_9HELO|nr:f32288ad-980c-456f-9155-2d5c369d118e [Sclerotinia trifoliorum]
MHSSPLISDKFCILLMACNPIMSAFPASHRCNRCSKCRTRGQLSGLTIPCFVESSCISYSFPSGSLATAPMQLSLYHHSP